MDICIDFDGTCVSHEFPEVGREIGAIPVLKKLVEKGHNLILFTMRSDCENNQGFSEEVPEIHNGDFLQDAMDWFRKNDILLYGIQCHPTQATWTTSPKAYGQMYIDDAALGCPLTQEKLEIPVNSLYHIDNTPIQGNGKRYFKPSRPYVDWIEVEKMLKLKNIL